MLEDEHKIVGISSLLLYFRFLSLFAAIGIGIIFLGSYASTFNGWWATWIIGYGIGGGVTYMGPVHHGWLWMPDRPGLVSGIILAGVGLSGLIFDNISMCKMNLIF